MTLGEKIKNLRESKGLSQDELARLVGYKSRSSINKIELDINDITQSMIVKLAKALGTTPCELINSDDVPTLSDTELQLVAEFRKLNTTGQEDALKYLKLLQLNPDYKKPSESRVYIAAKSADNRPSEIRNLTDEELKRIKAAKPVTSDDDL